MKRKGKKEEKKEGGREGRKKETNGERKNFI